MPRALLLVLLAGCVPKGRYEIAAVQLDATRTALSARTGQCAQDAMAQEARIAALEEEIRGRQLQLDELAVRAQLRDAELEALQEKVVALVVELDERSRELTRLRAELDRLTKRAPDAPDEAPEPTVGAQTLAEIAEQVKAHFHEQLEHARRDRARDDDARAFATLVAEGRVELAVRGEATVVRIPTALLFQEGFSTLSPRGQQIATQVAEALERVPGRRITVEGHTDDRPVHTAEFASNWERGFSQALAVLRALEGAGAPATLSVASFAGTRPLVAGDRPEDLERNRRVELLIEADPDLLDAWRPTPPEAPAPPEPHEPDDGGGGDPGPEHEG